MSRAKERRSSSVGRPVDDRGPPPIDREPVTIGGGEADAGPGRPALRRPTGSRSRPLPGLQALRGIAALLVVLTHAAGEASARGGSLDAMPFGNFGVDIFFVISGFIIVYSSAPAFARPRATIDFMLRRVARVVPLYWIVSTAYLLLILALREHRHLTLGYIASSYLFIPAPEPEDGAFFPFYFPGWTLEFEMFFYLCFALVLPWRRTIAVGVITAIMVAVLALGNLMPVGPVLSFLATTQLLEFVAGCLLAEVYLRGLRLSGPVCLVLATAASTAVLVTSYQLGGWPDLRGLVWGLPAMALVAAATLRSWPSTSVIMSALTRLGDASYSLYLVHYLVFVAVAHAIRARFHDGAVLRPLGYTSLIMVLAIGAAFLCFHVVERPLTRRLRRWVPEP